MLKWLYVLTSIWQVFVWWTLFIRRTIWVLLVQIISLYTTVQDTASKRMMIQQENWLILYLALFLSWTSGLKSFGGEIIIVYSLCVRNGFFQLLVIKILSEYSFIIMWCVFLCRIKWGSWLKYSYVAGMCWMVQLTKVIKWHCQPISCVWWTLNIFSNSLP